MEKKQRILIIGNVNSKMAAQVILEQKTQGHKVVIITPEEAKKMKLVDKLVAIMGEEREQTEFKIEPMDLMPDVIYTHVERKQKFKPRNEMPWRCKNKRKGR